MSRPWNSAVCLRVGSRCVEAGLTQGWPRARTLALARQRLDRLESIRPASTGAAPSAQARGIESVLDELSRHSSLRGAPLRVELCGPDVHLDVVAGDFARTSDRQLELVARACLDEILGEDAAECEMRWQLQDDNRHLLVCAIPVSCRQAIGRAAEAHQLRLTRLQCDFVTRWNKHRRSLITGSTAFAVLTGEDLVASWVVKGVVRAVSMGVVRSATARARSGFEGKSSFTANGANDRSASAGATASQEGAAALDAHIDRFLHALGQDPHGPVTYVLAAKGADALALSERWNMPGRVEAAA